MDGKSSVHEAKDLQEVLAFVETCLLTGDLEEALRGLGVLRARLTTVQEWLQEVHDLAFSCLQEVGA